MKAERPASVGATALFHIVPSTPAPSSEPQFVERGVWLCPWLGHNGRQVYASYTADHRKFEEIELPLGVSPAELEQGMLARLKRADIRRGGLRLE